MTETADNAMSRLTPSGGEGAVALGAAFHQVAQGLAHLQEALQLQRQQADRKLLEVLRRQEQEAERRLQEALHLQEQRAASALREAVGQMEAKLQEKDAAIRTLEQRLEETLQRAAVKGGGVVEEGAMGLAGTQQGMAAVEERMEGFEEQGALWRLEGRMDELESSLHRAIQKFFPRVDGLLRQLEGTPPRKASSFPPLPSAPSGATCGEAATEEGAAGGREDNPPPVESLAPTASSRAFPAPSSAAASVLGASVSEAAGHQRENPDAGQGTQAEDERVQRQRTELQIRRVMERVKAARASPSPLRGDLLKAVIDGGLQDVQRLLDAGADVNCIDKNGRTPLLLAFLNARFEDMIELLLQRGADVNAVNIVGTSAMRQAACMDYSGRCMVRLVAAGGDVNARSETGATPLHCAADMRNVAAVRVLLAAGARKDLKPWKGLLKNKTPFEVAGTPEIKDLLRP